MIYITSVCRCSIIDLIYDASFIPLVVKDSVWYKSRAKCHHDVAFSWKISHLYSLLSLHTSPEKLVNFFLLLSRPLSSCVILSLQRQHALICCVSLSICSSLLRPWSSNTVISPRSVQYLESHVHAVLIQADVSAALLARLNLFEQYSAAAYCPSNNDAPAGTLITCSTGNCPLVEAAGATAVYEFQHSLLTDVTGYVATDPTNKLVVVAFRGSESIVNYIADAEFPLTEAADICALCQAETGFYTSWEEAKSGVVAAVQSAAAANHD